MWTLYTCIKIGTGDKNRLKKGVDIVKKGKFLGASTRLQKAPVNFVMSVIQCIENSSSETDMVMLKPVTFMN